MWWSLNPNVVRSPRFFANPKSHRFFRLIRIQIQLSFWKAHIHHLSQSTAYLDLVPPVHLCTPGSSLSPFQPVRCCVFNFLPCDANPFQVLLKCPTPCHPWASSSSCATCWSPRYCRLDGSRSTCPAIRNLRSVTMSASFLEQVVRKISSFVMWSLYVTCSIFLRHR